jgi:hypothetical protein
MQTFLPLPNYYESMKCLDKSRLGNQVWREGLTLIRGGWKWHPANKMWRGYEYHLGLYLLRGIDVLCERGKYYAEVKRKIVVEMDKFPRSGPPPWLGDERLHASHRSALLAKNFEWYSQFGWKDKPDPMHDGKYSYWWPTKI